MSTQVLCPFFNLIVYFAVELYEILMYFWILTSYPNKWGFPLAQMVKNLPALHETWVQSLSQEDPLEKEMVTHSSILAWRIPWTEEPGGLQSMGL